jgi:hypothetical protein
MFLNHLQTQIISEHPSLLEVALRGPLLDSYMPYCFRITVHGGTFSCYVITLVRYQRVSSPTGYLFVLAFVLIGVIWLMFREKDLAFRNPRTFTLWGLCIISG